MSYHKVMKKMLIHKVIHCEVAHPILVLEQARLVKLN